MELRRKQEEEIRKKMEEEDRKAAEALQVFLHLLLFCLSCERGKVYMHECVHIKAVT